ncbi:hypothetical protein K1719_033342 [Acacia pycnantha]|nr:hypothetical protein K1719_033342 [Acacia pycnantha]
MDFLELEAATELPVLPYDPLVCTRCNTVLNPYARVDYQSQIWHCPFCFHTNPFPHSYSGIGETNLPAELFPTYSTVEYAPNKKIMSPKANNGSNINLNRTWDNGLSSSSKSLSSVVSSSSLVSSFSSSSLVSSFSSPSLLAAAGGGGDSRGIGPAFVFVVDISSSSEELQSLKNELLLVLEKFPENALVGLITFDSMVYLYDMGYSECSRNVLFHGERAISSNQVLNSVWFPLLYNRD